MKKQSCSDAPMKKGVMQATKGGPTSQMAMPTSAPLSATYKKGGEVESKATHKAEMSAMKTLDKRMSAHAAKPASKAHAGLKKGGKVGYKDGGFVKMANMGISKMCD